ncbi:MAG: TRAP transporter small permease [Burkholderiales bacterium]
MGADWLDPYARFTSAVNRVFLTIAGIVIATILGIISYDLVLRNIFDAPTLWALDFSRFLLVFAAFFAMAPTLEHGQHVTVDLVEQMMKPGPKRIMQIFALVLVLIFAAFLMWQITRTAIEAFEDDSLFPTVVPVKLKHIYWVGPLGILQFILTAIARLATAIRTPAT